MSNEIKDQKVAKEQGTEEAIKAPQTPEAVLDGEKLAKLAERTIEDIRTRADEVTEEGVSLLESSLGNLRAEPGEVAQAKEALGVVNGEIGRLSAARQNEVQEVVAETEEAKPFDRAGFLSEVETKLEEVHTVDDVLSVLKETLQSQKDRGDLRLLFDNFRFASTDGSEKSLDIEDFFEGQIRSLDGALEEPGFKDGSIDEIKRDAKTMIEELVLPRLEGEEDPELLTDINKVQEKVAVQDYDMKSLVDFLNSYRRLSKGREKVFDKFVFKDSPKKKDSLFDTEDVIRLLDTEPELLEKIDVINAGGLDLSLGLFGASGAFGIADQYTRFADLRAMPLHSLKLAENNQYFHISGDLATARGVGLITEERLREIHEFSGDCSGLSIGEILEYHERIEGLPDDRKELCKRAYTEKHLDGRFSEIGDRTFFQMIANDVNFHKIKTCYEGGLLKSFYQVSDLEKIVSSSEEDIELAVRTGKDLDAGFGLLEKDGTLNAQDVAARREMGERAPRVLLGGDKAKIEKYLEDVRSVSPEDLDLFYRWQSRKMSADGGIYGFFVPMEEVLREKESFSALSRFYRSEPDAELLVFGFIAKRDSTLPDVLRSVELFKEDPGKYFSDNPEGVFGNYDNAVKILQTRGQSFDQPELDSVFDHTLRNHPELFLNKSNFPFSPEQRKVIDIFAKINASASPEMKNMALELTLQLVYGGELSTIDERYEKVENIFVENNIPFVGKQEKTCEALHPHIDVQSNSSPELRALHSENARRLLVFKDLLSSSFNSLNFNLEQYLTVFQGGQKVLDKYEAGEQLSSEEEEELRRFFRKVNALSENTRKTDKFNKFDLEGMSLGENLQALKHNFGVREGQTITGRFESAFLQRVGIGSFSEALSYYEELRKRTDLRNREFADAGQIALGGDDLIKGVKADFFDSNLDRGFYSPEFIGAETVLSKDKAKTSDSTPWDTDVVKVGNRGPLEVVRDSVASKYGDIVVVIRDRGQFHKTENGQPLTSDQSKLELFNTGTIEREDRYGIRTGFGSTEVDALLVKDEFLQGRGQLDSLKFSIAKKGFYIPICDKEGKVIFTPAEFEEYRKIFSGVGKYHGEPIGVNEEWKSSRFGDEIREFSQTEDNLRKIGQLRDGLYSDMQDVLSSFGVALHKGRYDDSVAGAKIIDTGSTGRGAALDQGYDFDFVVKMDDSDYDKVGRIGEMLKSIYPYSEDYENTGMRTFRFKSFERDGNTIDLDISFVKKSDSEELDANEAIAQKYDAIRQTGGTAGLLGVLTNIRFAKKELKKAGCYKKGLTGKGEQQGGLGGIGVENWIVKNGGDAVAAFRDFYGYAYRDGVLVPFDEFKKSYHVFSAGENIRGGVRAENFVYNMDEAGYQKMAELSRKFVE